VKPCSFEGCAQPRWSAHAACRFCVKHADPRNVKRKIAMRSPWLTKRPAWLKPANIEQRLRYAVLAVAGVPYAIRQKASKTELGTARALRAYRKT
jgi:hypothetical protein